MNSIYYETNFYTPGSNTALPTTFGIITAYATTRESWSDSKNIRADTELEAYLRSNFNYVHGITGFSPDTGRSEPGWIVNCDWKTCCDIGLSFKQDAIYFVSDHMLSVSYCDDRRAQIKIGDFKERINLPGSSSLE